MLDAFGVREDTFFELFRVAVSKADVVVGVCQVGKISLVNDALLQRLNTLLKLPISIVRQTNPIKQLRVLGLLLKAL